MGMLKTKSLSDALAKLPPSVTTLYVYCPDPDRWHAPEDFQALLTSPVSPHSDVTQLPHITDDLLITGSLYFIATLRPMFDTLAPL
ncbi:hypothetical protein EBR57_06730 [bacterium]|nr:hypothetical protein [bacterium]